MPKWLKKTISTLSLTALLLISALTHATETIELTGRNVVLMDENMDDASTHKFMQAIVGARASLEANETLYVVITSNGGNYKSALTIEAVIANVTSTYNPNVAVICKFCASSAGYVFATFKGPKLVITSSNLMMHEMVLLRVTAVNAENKAIIEDLKVNSDSFNRAMYSHLRISKEEYESKIVGKSWDLYGADIVKHHVADKLVNVHCNAYLLSIIPHTCNNDLNQAD
jgi:ATP-dependent protease ClpP protease subunit